MVDCIRLPDILRFLNSGAGKRMRAAARAGCLWREQPFVLGVPASEIYPEIQSEEMILVQGIIDVCFEENGELVVLDYKTDRVRKAEELREKYHAQLDYYAEALEQLLRNRSKRRSFIPLHCGGNQMLVFYFVFLNLFYIFFCLRKIRNGREKKCGAFRSVRCFCLHYSADPSARLQECICADIRQGSGNSGSVCR